MSQRGHRILIQPDGSVRVMDRFTERRFRDRAGEYELAVASGPIMVWRRQIPEGEQPPTRLLMAGEIVSRLGILELINLIAQSNWRGELVVNGTDGSERALVLDQGALKYCRSNLPADLLGEVLYHRGILDRQTLDELLRLITPERRFGEICMERKLMDKEELYKLLQVQAEQIFFGALLVSDGTYSFSTVDDAAPPPSHTLHVPVQGLLMEGVQRIDEMALFRERIPSASYFPVAREGVSLEKIGKDLDDSVRAVFTKSHGTTTIEEIARTTGLGEFLTTKAVYHLLQQNLVELRSSAGMDEFAVRRLVASFNEVMRDIFVAVATYGGVDHTRTTLSAWIQGSGYGPFFGDDVNVDGSISIDVVVEALRGAQIERPLEALHHALHELAAFALFSATTTLPRDQELILSREVNRRLKAIRI